MELPNRPLPPQDIPIVRTSSFMPPVLTARAVPASPPAPPQVGESADVIICVDGQPVTWQILKLGETA